MRTRGRHGERWAKCPEVMRIVCLAEPDRLQASEPRKAHISGQLSRQSLTCPGRLSELLLRRLSSCAVSPLLPDSHCRETDSTFHAGPCVLWQWRLWTVKRTATEV